jgi:hypothetical protein
VRGKSGYGRRTGRDENDVSEKSRERSDQEPKNEPYVTPLLWWTENLRKLCPMNAPRGCSANDQIWSVAPEKKRAEASSRVDVNLALLVSQRNLLQVRTVTIRAPQVQVIAPTL